MSTVPVILNPECMPFSCLVAGQEPSIVVFAESIRGTPDDVIDRIRFHVEFEGVSSDADYEVGSEASDINYHVFTMEAVPDSDMKWSISAWNRSGLVSIVSGVNRYLDMVFADTRIFIGYKGAYRSVAHTDNFEDTGKVAPTHNND